jgi:hypothetical protein
VDYLRWALWLIYRFRIPAHLQVEDRPTLEADATEQALEKIAGYAGASKALLALQLLRLQELAAPGGGRR